MENILKTLTSNKIIAIVRNLPKQQIVDLAKALNFGGIIMIEITFNQGDPTTWEDTVEGIQSISKYFKDRVCVGAGTIMSHDQLVLAYEAGVKYIVTPNVDIDIIHKAKDLGLGVFPGAMTPTEIVDAYNYGADAVKVFPAGNLGSGYIKAIRAPLSHIPIIAVGGLDEKNIGQFFQAGCIAAGVGGNLVNKKWVEAGEWDLITSLSSEFVKAAKLYE